MAGRGKNCTFYCCYLLQSVPKPGSFYIGSTPDPYRRLRQHNGELTQGARRTKVETRRPWRMICIVSGFQSRISALQFEHAWQHPYQTRHILPEERISPKKSSSRGIDKHMGNLRLLTRAPAFGTSPLAVHLFEAAAETAWDKNKFAITTAVSVERDLRANEHEPIGNGVSLGHLKTKKDSEYLKKSLEIVHSGTTLTAVCPACYYTTPLTALATQFLEKSPHDNDLIPKDGECPECHSYIEWHKVASNARHIQHLNKPIDE